MVGGGAGKESENYGSFLVLNKDTKLCPPLPRPVLGSCCTFYIFCLCSHPFSRLSPVPCFGMRLK